MIPGFVVNEAVIQDHIHLGYAYRDGTSPSGFDPYGAPPYTFKARRRVPKYNYQAGYAMAWDGTPHDHVLVDEDKKAIIFKDFIFDVRVTLQELDILESLSKNRVYFIDNRHCPPTRDHTSFIKLMYFDELDYGEHYEPTLQLNVVTIVLRDMTTKAPITE